MLLTVSSGMDSFLQFCTVLFIFVLVLLITWTATKLIANLQNGQSVYSANIEVIETYRLTTNKYIQIVKTGEKYLAIAVCKDTVTMLAEIPAGQIHLPDRQGGVMPDFKKMLEMARRKDNNRKNEE